MHYMLPNVVPPIDREYTLRLPLRQHHDRKRRRKRVENDERAMISGFFIPVATNAVFAAERWIAAGRPWDTSVMKAIDNLLIGARKTATA
jgi:hypothetical protein